MKVVIGILGSVLVACAGALWLLPLSKPSAVSPPPPKKNIWEVRSFDTMKTSRDLARAKLYDITYDQEIDKQVQGIKALGANYVALGTPYDKEFVPYLKRWVRAARKHNLKVWYRGNFSGYEGWFEYPKNVSPDQLLQKSEIFIAAHEELFQDGDIFDLCPECENAGHWPQPKKNSEYNAFLQRKHKVLTAAFERLGKDVNISYPSIIGGRAKEVLDAETIKVHGNVVALDHETASSRNYGEYIEYFQKNFQAKTVFSELGAPIPDLHGSMTQEQQAAFLKKVLDELYRHPYDVLGLNYWVYNVGTTAIVNKDGTPRKAASVIESYFKPGWIQGRVVNTLKEGLADSKVFLNNTFHTKTNQDGFYSLPAPAGEYTVRIEHPKYATFSAQVSVKKQQEATLSAVLQPREKDLHYKVREALQSLGL